MIVAARLHEVVEDGHTWLERHFGAQVAGLVDQLTKLGWSHHLSAAENHHKLTQGGTAAIKIKLADRLHHMRTIGCFGLEKQRGKAEETMAYYLPLAPLVGLPKIGQELAQIVKQILSKKSP